MNTGSPRKNGNSFALTDAFIKAAGTQGSSVVRFDTVVFSMPAVLTFFSTRTPTPVFFKGLRQTEQIFPIFLAFKFFPNAEGCGIMP